MIAGSPVDINDLFSLSLRTVSKKVEAIRLDICFMLSIQMNMNRRDVCMQLSKDCIELDLFFSVLVIVRRRLKISLILR